jgi:phosphomannomutase
MRTIYLFDVDGTLTQPLSPVDEEFASVFINWVETTGAHVYLVTGSDIKKTRRQLFGALRDVCQGVFCCSGNQYWEKDNIVYQHRFRAPKKFIEDLELYLDNSTYPFRTGNHIERRAGMVNFSTVGRNASAEEREKYNTWDKKHLERQDIAEYVTSNYPSLDVSIGGTISVDIYRKGRDKSQVVDYLRGTYGEEIGMIFVGDRNVPGGNDWPLAMKLDEDPNSHWFQVHSHEETRALIEHSRLFIGEAGV